MKKKSIFCLLLFLLQLVYSQNTVFDFSLINPSITSTNLRSAWFFDEYSGYMAGKAGSVLFTKNSGKTWKEYETPKRIWIVSLFFFDMQNGWGAGGFNGQPYLINTNDSGYTWKDHSIPGLKNVEIEKVKFRNQNSGWITGGSTKNGFVYFTNDGGNTWINRSPPDLTVPNNVIQDIILIDSSTVCVCGYSGYLARSEDNGLHWEQIKWKSIAPDSMIVAPLEQFQKVNDTVLYCKGKEDILRSDDGGITWNAKFFIGAHFSMQLGAFYFHNPDSGFAIGGFGENALRFTTMDGGTTWKAFRDTVTNTPELLLFPGNGVWGYMIGRLSEVYRIMKMGERKTQLNKGYAPMSAPFVNFYDKNHGCLSGLKPIGLRTTSDGGKTWQVVDSSRSYGKLIQKDATHFATDSGYITVDGGRSWNKAPDGYTGIRTLYKALSNDAVFFTLYNGSGTGVRLFVSTDWFTTSQERQLPASGTLFFMNADTGWLAEKTTVYMTTDGARSWNQIGNLEGVYGAGCLYFVDNFHGWAGGVTNDPYRNVIVFNTCDGGKTWARQDTINYLPDTLFPPDFNKRSQLPKQICARNQNEAWFVDEYINVFYTYDGGKRWQQILLPQKCGDVPVGSIALAGDSSVFVTGYNGMGLLITPMLTDRVRFNIRTGKTEKKKFEFVLPFSFEQKQYSNAYELNGASMKIDTGKKRRRICRPVIAR